MSKFFNPVLYESDIEAIRKVRYFCDRLFTKLEELKVQKDYNLLLIVPHETSYVHQWGSDGKFRISFGLFLGHKKDVMEEHSIVNIFKSNSEETLYEQLNGIWEAFEAYISPEGIASHLAELNAKVEEQARTEYLESL